MPAVKRKSTARTKSRLLAPGSFNPVVFGVIVTILSILGYLLVTGSLATNGIDGGTTFDPAQPSTTASPPPPNPPTSQIGTDQPVVNPPLPPNPPPATTHTTVSPPATPISRQPSPPPASPITRLYRAIVPPSPVVTVKPQVASNSQATSNAATSYQSALDPTTGQLFDANAVDNSAGPQWPPALIALAAVLATAFLIGMGWLGLRWWDGRRIY